MPTVLYQAQPLWAPEPSAALRGKDLPGYNKYISVHKINICYRAEILVGRVIVCGYCLAIALLWD